MRSNNLEPVGQNSTRVWHTCGWTQLTNETRFQRARATTPKASMASLDRLAAVATAD